MNAIRHVSEFDAERAHRALRLGHTIAPATFAALMERADDARQEAQDERDDYETLVDDSRAEIKFLESTLADREQDVQAAIRRADELQERIEAAMDGNTAALVAARMDAIRDEILAKIDQAGAALVKERKAGARGALVLRLRDATRIAFASVAPIHRSAA